MKNSFFLFESKTIGNLIICLLFTSNIFSQSSYETIIYKDYGLSNMFIPANEQNYGHKIYKDSKNNIWVYGCNGLKKYSNLNITNSICEDYLDNKLTYSICEDKKGNILVGSNNGKLYIYDGVSWVVKKVKGYSITALYCDNEGNIWIGMRGWLPSSTLYKYDGMEFTKIKLVAGVIVNIIEYCRNIVISIEHVEVGNINTVYTPIGTANIISTNSCSSIYYISLTNDTSGNLLYDNTIKHNSLINYCSYIDKHGNLWFGNKGLEPNIIKYTNFINYTFYNNENGLATGGMVTSIQEDENSNIWFGTNNGLFKYSNNEWTHYSIENGLIDNSIIGFIIDNKNIYVYSKKGITILKNL